MGLTQRDKALAIAKAGIEAVKPASCMAVELEMRGETLVCREQSHDLSGRREVIVIGIGKASAAMAQIAESLLADRIAAGIVAVKDSHQLPLARLPTFAAAHPVPDERSPAIGRCIRRLIAAAPRDSLILALLSGGGSALITDPIDSITLADLAATTDQLLRAGADIGELNTVRKHLSRTQGGRLAAKAAGREVLALVISDVLGDRLDTVASGPFYPDPTTWAEAQSVIDRYSLQDHLPVRVSEAMSAGLAGQLPETPKPGGPEFAAVSHVVIANLAKAADAARDRALLLGLDCQIRNLQVTGPADRAAAMLVAAGRAQLAVADRPFCLIYGGETTVKVTGSGSGGRCQHMALAAARQLAGSSGLTVLAVGTDGTDGPTSAAGGFADGETISRGRAMGVDADVCIGDNDSNRYLAASGDLLSIGPTQTNVNDLLLVLGNP